MNVPQSKLADIPRAFASSVRPANRGLADLREIAFGYIGIWYNEGITFARKTIVSARR